MGGARRRHWSVWMLSASFGLAAGCGDDGGGGDVGTSTFSPTTSTSDDSSSGSGSTSTTMGTSTTSDDGSSGGPDPQTSGSVTDGGTAAVCEYECGSDGDCTVGGDDLLYRCQMGRCAVPCSVDDECVAYFSLWLIQTCSASSDCDSDTCVAYEGGTGGCAFTPDIGPCEDIGLVSVPRMTVEGLSVNVCAEPSAVCGDAGAGAECFIPCDDFVDCYGAGSGDTCTEDGKCVFACVESGDCPASNHDNVTAACG